MEEDVPPIEGSVHEGDPSVEGPLCEEVLPVDETSYAEDSHQVEAPPTGGYSSAAEELSIKDSTEAVQAHLVRVSVKDLVSYKSWGRLTPDKKANRAKKLTAKGLPIPSEDGLVSIFVAGVRT